MSGGPVARYAKGARAWGLCDRCGWRYLLNELRWEIFDQRRNGLRVCRNCLDKDHPQLRQGEIIVTDPESLYDPRPDLNLVPSTQLFGWRPVGHPLTGTAKAEVGTVTVVTT